MTRPGPAGTLPRSSCGDLADADVEPDSEIEPAICCGGSTPAAASGSRGASSLPAIGCLPSRVWPAARKAGQPDEQARQVLIASWDGGGNAPPALNLSARLVRLGHQVRVLGWQSMAARAAPLAPSSRATLQCHHGLRGGFRGCPGVRLLPALAGPGTRDDILAEAKGFAPDVVVVDCMMDAGLQAAHDFGLRAPSWTTSRTPDSCTSGRRGGAGGEGALSSARRVLSWRWCRLASTRPARCRPTPGMSAHH